MSAPDTFAVAYLVAPGSILGPGTTPYAVVADPGDLPFRPRFIHVGRADGAPSAVTYVANGVTINDTLEVGYHPIRPDKITSIAAGTTVVAWE